MAKKLTDTQALATLLQGGAPVAYGPRCEAIRKARKIMNLLRGRGWRTPKYVQYLKAANLSVAVKLLHKEAGRANADAQVKRLVQALCDMATPEGELDAAVAAGPEREELQAAFDAVMGVGALPGKV